MLHELDEIIKRAAKAQYIDDCCISLLLVYLTAPMLSLCLMKIKFNEVLVRESMRKKARKASFVYQL